MMNSPKPETLSTFDFFQKFPSEEAARLHVEARRWGGTPFCGHCGSTSVVECKDHKPMPYRCKDCRKHFSIRTGTVLAESRLPIQKWLLAIQMLTSARKGIPSTQMARELGITQKSAWFLSQRIRETWQIETGQLVGPVEVDETYFGGKRKNMKKAKREKLTGRGTAGKTAVVGAKDRATNQVRAKVVENTDAKTLQGFVADQVVPDATICTDEATAYQGLPYEHETVKHSVGEYVNGMAHTNGIESFWALMKRGYYGIYHHMSEKHLHRYVREFSFRYNTSRAGTMPFINMTIDRMAQKRLTYKHLINA